MATTTTLQRQGEKRATEPSDADLLDRVRADDDTAYGLLYQRHEPAARSLARYLTHSAHDADDVVADAFARVLRAIKGGHGPTEAFRPYLLTAVRRTVWRRSDEARHHHLAADDDEAELLDLRLAVEPEDRSDEALILRAFGELPERWQLVLWHTEIEGQPPAEVAPMLGLSPNATAALAVRAREGLRQAYLQAHLQSRPADDCRFTVEHLGAYVRDGLGKRDTAKVEEHLGGCDHCTGLRDDLGSLNKVLRGVVGPAVLGTGGARWLSSRASEDAGATVVDTAAASAHRGLRFAHAVGLAGVAAVVLAGIGLSSQAARPADDRVPIAPAAAVEHGPPAGDQLVQSSLVGTPASSAHVSDEPCDGATLPLSLPEGSTITGAALVQAPGGGLDPSILDPGQAESLQPLDSGSDALVGAGGACVGADLIDALSAAPADTALAVSFLDPLGDLQVLVVPQVVDVVRSALTQAADLAVAAEQQQVADYLHAVAQATDELTASSAGGEAGASGSQGSVATIPALPDGSGLPPVTLPPVTVPSVGPTVDGVTGTVGDAVDGVTDTVGGLPGH